MIKYPCYRKHKILEHVVRFDERRRGVVIHKGNSKLQVGWEGSGDCEDTNWVHIGNSVITI